jgi:hypothetical protein
MIHESIQIGKQCALLSFIIGTFLFMIFILDQSILLLKTGIIYLVISLFINVFILIHLIYLAIFNSKERKDLAQTCGILLLNIPIIIGYIYLITLSLFPIKY